MSEKMILKLGGSVITDKSAGCTIREDILVHAAREIAAGASIAAEDVAVLRTEKVLRPGIGPEFLRIVVGATARRRIPDGEGIEWADLL